MQIYSCIIILQFSQSLFEFNRSSSDSLYVICILHDSHLSLNFNPFNENWIKLHEFIIHLHCYSKVIYKELLKTVFEIHMMIILLLYLKFELMLTGCTLGHRLILSGGNEIRRPVHATKLNLND